MSLESLREGIRNTSLFWVLASVFVSGLSYWLRAWRWKLLIEAGEKQPTRTSRAFIALMMGYLANLLVPRAGEVARCGVLAKTEQTQVGKLFGTVLLERSLDLLFLIGTVLLAFLLENEIFRTLFKELISLEELGVKILNILPLLLGGSLVAVLFIYFLFKRYRDRGLVKKLRHFIRDLIQGLLSLKQVENQTGFWSSSFGIWICYYLMMVFVAWAMPTTASLSFSSILLVMVMGSIGMVAPVQGGIGTFHALVAFILMAYGLSNEEGKIFAVIIHSSQVLTVVFLGLISMLFFFKITSRTLSKTV